MSVAGIVSTAVFSLGAQIFQNRAQKLKQEFQQVGQDLQSGNLTAAQSDFATLQQMRPQSSPTASSQGTSSISQDFNQLAADLKAGNTTAAQQDYAKIQQDFRSQGAQGHRHHHHNSADDGSDSGSAISQLFTQLGTALQSGSLSAAQQAYSTMLQDFQQVASVNALSTRPDVTTFSVTA
jgi:outer membrane protein assembly factor BamD (BamD/ComL family)